MTITTFDQFIGASKQYLSYAKTASRTTVANSWFSIFDQAGNPGAGTLAGSSTSPGVVPTDATAGFPTIDAFGAGNVGYLAQVEFGSAVACRLKIFDCVFKAGAYNFNANVTGITSPSWLSRMPGGSYGDTQLWLEQVTAGTGNQNVAVGYLDQGGAAGTTGTIATATNIAGRMWQLPLAAGDTGVSGITSVVGTNATGGTFNILVMRPLWSGRVRITNDGDVHDLAKTGMPQVFADSALFVAVNTDGTSSSVPELEMVIANG